MRIDSLLELVVSTFPDRVAVSSGIAAHTYRELLGAADDVADTVRRSGARSVAFVGVNGPRLPIAAFAASRAGVPFVPLNYRLASPQLRLLLGRLDRPHVITDDAYRSIAEWAAEHLAAQPSRPVADLAGTAAIVFTSGTTAEPKGVILRHDQLASYVMETVEYGSAADTEAALVCVPPYHIAGVAAILTNVFRARRLVYLPDFTAEKWLVAVRRESITTAMVVPTMLARIVDHLPGTHADTPSLRTLSYGGGRMPSAVLERALGAFPDCDFVNAYGLTETSSTIALLSPEDHRTAVGSSDPAIRARLGSVGRLIPSVEGEVRDDEGHPATVERVGELWVRGPQVSGEYVGEGSKIDSSGWFSTGDRAHFDAGGYLFLHGRGDDTIIRGGENIAPAEIEDALLHHPGIREVGVVGVPDDEWGQRIVAAIVPQPGTVLSVDQLRQWARERLRSSRTPDDVVFRVALPLTDTGKLRRRVLVDELLAHVLDGEPARSADPDRPPADPPQR